MLHSGAYDAIVVGAGPAGSAAARSLALNGHRVILIERDRLPRYKPCGGGLGPKTVARLPFSISEIPSLRVERIDFRLRSEAPVSWDLPDDFPFYMVMRSDLDFRLARSAVEAGAELHDCEPVRSIDRTGGRFVVHSDRSSYSAPFLIGADGALGITRSALGIERRSEMGIALECEIEVPQEVYSRYASAPVFDIDAVPDGYGWVFPKQTHLSAGIGTMKPRGVSIRDALLKLILRYGLAEPEMLPDLVIHTHPLPLASSGERARSGNALMAGDAAGVADGFGGEGVCYSLASGDLAAQSVSRALVDGTGALDSYEEQLDSLIRRDHGYAHLMGRIVRRFPDPGYRILTSLGEGKSVLIPLLLGEIGFGEALRRLPRLLALDRSQPLTGES